MNNFNNLLKESKKTFPKHKKILVRIKDFPENPFNSLTFEKLIRDKALYSEFILYIHDEYLRINSKQIKNYEKVKIPLDQKLWIEIYEVFDFIGFVKEDKD